MDGDSTLGLGGGDNFGSSANFNRNVATSYTYDGELFSRLGFLAIPSPSYNHAVSGSTAGSLLWRSGINRVDSGGNCTGAGTTSSVTGSTLTLNGFSACVANPPSGVGTQGPLGIVMPGTVMSFTGPYDTAGALTVGSLASTTNTGLQNQTYTVVNTGGTVASTAIYATANPMFRVRSPSTTAINAAGDVYWNANQHYGPQAGIWGDASFNFLHINDGTNDTSFTTTTYNSIAGYDYYLRSMGPNSTVVTLPLTGGTITPSVQNRVVLAGNTKPTGSQLVTNELHTSIGATTTPSLLSSGDTWEADGCGNAAQAASDGTTGFSVSTSGAARYLKWPVVFYTTNTTALTLGTLVTPYASFVAASASAGQYGVDSGGVYHWATADAGKNVSLSYCSLGTGRMSQSLIAQQGVIDMRDYWTSNSAVYSGSASGFNFGVPGALNNPWVHSVDSYDIDLDLTSGTTLQLPIPTYQASNHAHWSPTGGVIEGKLIAAATLALYPNTLTPMFTPPSAGVYEVSKSINATHEYAFTLPANLLPTLSTAANGTEICYVASAGSAVRTAPVCALSTSYSGGVLTLAGTGVLGHSGSGSPCIIIATGLGGTCSGATNAGDGVAYLSATTGGNGGVIVYGSPPWDATNTRIPTPVRSTGLNFAINNQLDWATTTNGSLTAGGTPGTNFPSAGANFNCQSASIGTSSSNWFPQFWTINFGSGISTSITAGTLQLACGYGTGPDGTAGWFWIDVLGVWPSGSPTIKMTQTLNDGNAIALSGVNLAASDTVRTYGQIALTPSQQSGAPAYMIGALPPSINAFVTFASATNAHMYGSAAGTTPNGTAAAIANATSTYSDGSNVVAYTDCAFVDDGGINSACPGSPAGSALELHMLTLPLPTNTDEGNGATPNIGALTINAILSGGSTATGSTAGGPVAFRQYYKNVGLVVTPW